MKLAYSITKKEIANSFNRAVDRYDTAAILQRMTADTLVDLLNQHSMHNNMIIEFSKNSILKSSPKVKTEPGFILEIGTGTGYLTKLLRKSKPESWLLGIDIAENMVKKTKQHSILLDYEEHNDFVGYADSFFLCADGDVLPLQNNMVSIIVSNLCLQWCPDLFDTFSEYFRVLQDQGMLIFATLGPKTLCELRACWDKLDANIHINHFIGSETIKKNLITSGFSVDSVHSTLVQQYYPNLIDLMKQLKALGAQNLNQGRHKSLTGKNKFKQLIAAYEAYRNMTIDDLFNLPASYEVIYVVAKKTTVG